MWVCADLKKYKYLTDVTLACDDQQVEAHKRILSASSPLFQKIFKHREHLCLPQRVVSILDFIYYGEVNVYQEDLNKFLDLATDLELKGLFGSSMYELTVDVRQHDSMIETSPVTALNLTTYLSNTIEEYSEQTDNANIKTNQKHVTVSDNVAEQIKSMMDKIGGLWTCAVCGVRKKDKGHMREHIETHLE